VARSTTDTALLIPRPHRAASHPVNGQARHLWIAFFPRSGGFLRVAGRRHVLRGEDPGLLRGVDRRNRGRLPCAPLEGDAIDQAIFTTGIERLAIRLPDQAERTRLDGDASLEGAVYGEEQHFRSRQDRHRRTIRGDSKVLGPRAFDALDLSDGGDHLVRRHEHAAGDSSPTNLGLGGAGRSAPPSREAEGAESECCAKLRLARGAGRNGRGGISWGRANRSKALSDNNHGREKQIGRRTEGHWEALIHSATANSFESKSTCANSCHADSGVGSFVGSMKSLFASQRIAMAGHARHLGGGHRNRGRPVKRVGFRIAAADGEEVERVALLHLDVVEGGEHGIVRGGPFAQRALPAAHDAGRDAVAFLREVRELGIDVHPALAWRGPAAHERLVLAGLAAFAIQLHAVIADDLVARKFQYGEVRHALGRGSSSPVP